MSEQQLTVKEQDLLRLFRVLDEPDQDLFLFTIRTLVNATKGTSKKGPKERSAAK